MQLKNDSERESGEGILKEQLIDFLHMVPSSNKNSRYL